MYEVNIKAQPEQFLDWDKPLSEQSPQVREAITNATIKQSPWLTPDTIPNASGANLL